MNFAIYRLKTSILFSKASVFSHIVPSMLSIAINLSLLGVRFRAISSRIPMRVERQLPTISFSSRYSSSFSPLRKMALMTLLSVSSTYFCYFLTSSMSSDDYNFSSISHQIKGCSSSVWMSRRTSCLASRKIEILLILKLMTYCLGEWRRLSRLRRRSSTAEWQICSCCVMVELIFLLSCCSTNSQTKLINLNYKSEKRMSYHYQPDIHLKYQPQQFQYTPDFESVFSLTSRHSFAVRYDRAIGANSVILLIGLYGSCHNKVVKAVFDEELVQCVNVIVLGLVFAESFDFISGIEFGTISG